VYRREGWASPNSEPVYRIEECAKDRARITPQQGRRGIARSPRPGDAAQPQKKDEAR
jgi:hypothetical protein